MLGRTALERAAKSSGGLWIRCVCAECLGHLGERAHEGESEVSDQGRDRGWDMDWDI